MQQIPQRPKPPVVDCRLKPRTSNAPLDANKKLQEESVHKTKTINILNGQLEELKREKSDMELAKEETIHEMKKVAKERSKEDKSEVCRSGTPT